MTDREKLEALRAWLVERRDHNQMWAEKSRTALGRMMETDLVRENNLILSKLSSLLAAPSEPDKLEALNAELHQAHQHIQYLELELAKATDAIEKFRGQTDGW